MSNTLPSSPVAEGDLPTTAGETTEEEEAGHQALSAAELHLGAVAGGGVAGGRHSSGLRGGRRDALAVGLSYFFAVFVLVTLNFVLPRAMPGSPLDSTGSAGGVARGPDDATRRAMAEYYGLDRPLAEQYLGYLGGLATGDLGTSMRHRVPVSTLLGERMPWTVLLAFTGMALATVVGVVAGIHSGWRRGQAADRGLFALFLAVRNIPPFVLGWVVIYALVVKLGWFPLAGAVTPFSDAGWDLRRLGDIAYHLVLPASVMAVQIAATQYLFMRASMVSEAGADHLLLGRAKGLADRRLKYGYAARNALLPVLSLTATQLGFAVTGTIFIETLFAYPGIGRLLFEAANNRDYPVLQGCFLVLTLGVLTMNLLADVLSKRLDPRIGAGA